MTVSAVILAAGCGSRMRTADNKIFLPIGGEALLSHTVAAWSRVRDVDDLLLVVRRADRSAVRKLVEPMSPQCRIVEGGEMRRDSSLAGVEAAIGDLVLIHDGARPFPSLGLIARVLAATRESRAAVPVLPLADLLHRVNTVTERIEEASATIGAGLVRVQTPQGFQRELVLQCLTEAPPDVRDDATAVLRAGHDVVTVRGEPTNIKVTHPEDLGLAEAIAAWSQQRGT
jgi:2-C-methyl-D-erythritol 4-phosphate cytidylyltransferase